ncbi:60S RIBOSOMAL PROTEIN L21 [Encephalitozoon cuniculi GB-M1]|uniref:Large ribosomal subunit protein eL21 n=2 Tax=Encephalitozoon cuniculi TaxID=6035 RepID=RL21_ENCCU|nr:60S ribosomal protein L21 [Encephalitozoon cuniculi GB-M1]Q8SRW8.1 RecName: Full=Large ribosomal subunit protein eL21; AltName: Full=60S ribosomal protein L21 [Encephalitozoon cuniculi GB-M1]7QEP_N1 Chain N1, 60S ribosomal protein L21 [Encephalitozoon cuniculi GB-M1]AGE95476.1 60S ribosomal protein l21 [Encephalitozoon cuniculi]KMV66147.1 ribosomal protein L21 [Encephalitozoon cuniculi EcunIII-L]UYI27884.1 ribosomal protein L21 [Encephalitozoon cuniculi]CAD26610.1 60S RIBOSOMAL PROTEIN L21
MRSKGYRRGTRYLFSQDHRKHGVAHVSKYLEKYEIGDMVDILVNPAMMKGMPHKYYHGRTGRVYDVKPRSLNVALYKRVRGKYVIKKIIVRIEHVRKSRCSEESQKRILMAAEMARDAESRGVVLAPSKRKIEGPRKAVEVSLDNNQPIEVGYEPHVVIF